MTLEQLEAEVTRLEDMQEIEDLERKYGYYFDTRRARDVLDLFSENTESVEIESHAQYLGKDGVRRMYMVGVGGQAETGLKDVMARREKSSGAGFNVITQLQGVVTIGAVRPIVGFLSMPNPDNPPTAFHPYPSGYHFPYSFPHPVTGEVDVPVSRYVHPMAT